MDISKPFEVKITGQDGITTTSKYDFPCENHIKMEFIQGCKSIEFFILPNELFRKVNLSYEAK